MIWIPSADIQAGSSLPEADELDSPCHNSERMPSRSFSSACLVMFEIASV